MARKATLQRSLQYHANRRDYDYWDAGSLQLWNGFWRRRCGKALLRRKAKLYYPIRKLAPSNVHAIRRSLRDGKPSGSSCFCRGWGRRLWSSACVWKLTRVQYQSSDARLQLLPRMVHRAIQILHHQDGQYSEISR